MCSLILMCATLLQGENVYSKHDVNLMPSGRIKVSPFLNHLVIHNNILYVGAVNRIFKLNFNLSVMANVSTGPQNESVRCDLPPSAECTYPKSLRNNVNKVLLVHEARGERPTVITCGSIFQGACETRFSNNLKLNRKYYSPSESTTNGGLSVQEVYAIAADTENGSTIAYIAPGPRGSNVMYVASTFTGINDRLIRDKVPAISTRKLSPRDEMFSFNSLFSSHISQRASRISIGESKRSTFIVNYIAGFTSGNFSYFLTTQPKAENVESLQITKLIHLCQQDEWLTSYVDLPLVCKSKNGKEYNKVKSARVIQPAALLQKSMMLEPHAEEVLIATFTDNSENNSAVCVFGMHEIRRKVLINVRLCRNGDTSANGNKYIQDGSDCRPNVSTGNTTISPRVRLS